MVCIEMIVDNLFSVQDVPYGTTYGQWTVRWWQWFFSVPKSESPIVDTTGEHADADQQFSSVFFLAGKLPGKDRILPNRTCKISEDRAILFPIINCEANALEYPELNTDEAILKHVKRDEDSIVLKECFVNGERIPAQRVKSEPGIFELQIKKDNVVDAPAGLTRASADGYWVFLKPLPEGKYEITFRGSCEFGRLYSGASYNIEVVKEVDVVV
jgi:hypothetical protein